MRPIIKVENVAKRYTLGKTFTHDTLRDSLSEFARAPLAKLRTQRNASAEILWALRDVNLEVSPGEVVGIIGRNGAGKSTLLKVLSRITEPTTGRVELYGRVGSLLEVGTGFHPELTGRENIFLNGVILGMSRRDIRKKFDEIVAFAEVEKFIDTPVKRYSSGMYVRLAFAVAAHLEPEILVVDEVLAVGDLAFQNKCLGKMQDVSLGGRTVLFVSHNMPAVTRLCSRAVLLESGRIIKNGATSEVIGAYLEKSFAASRSREWGEIEAPGTEELKLVAVSVMREDGSLINIAGVADTVLIKLEYVTRIPSLKFRCAVVFNTQGTCAFASVEPTETSHERPGRYSSTVKVPGNLLAEGEYMIHISIFTSRGVKQYYLQQQNVVALHVYDPMNGDSARGNYAERLAGVVSPRLDWTLQYEGPA